MLPEPKDVPGLMANLVAWLKSSETAGLPCLVRAGLAHYQLATTHPYYNGALTNASGVFWLTEPN